MKHQIESFRTDVTRYNFDNGLTLRAQILPNVGMISCEVWKISPRNGNVIVFNIPELRNPQGADAFADWIHTISSYTKNSIALLRKNS